MLYFSKIKSRKFSSEQSYNVGRIKTEMPMNDRHATEMHTFLNQHCDKARVNQLVAELVCAIGSADPDATQGELLTCVADQIYRNIIAQAPQDFVTVAVTVLDPDPYMHRLHKPKYKQAGIRLTHKLTQQINSFSHDSSTIVHTRACLAVSSPRGLVDINRSQRDLLAESTALRVASTDHSLSS